MRGPGRLQRYSSATWFKVVWGVKRIVCKVPLGGKLGKAVGPQKQGYHSKENRSVTDILSHDLTHLRVERMLWTTLLPNLNDGGRHAYVNSRGRC